MRRLKLLVIPLALIVVTLVALQLPGRHGTGVAEAFPNADGLAVSGQTCLSDGSVALSLSWTSYNQGGQWVDLTLFDNGFAPGTFVGLGPLASAQNTFTWSGLRPGLLHYLRLNTLTPQGWAPSYVSFATRGDCAAFPAGNATNVAAVTQTCDSAGVSVTVTWTPSNQGTQWLDLSLYDNGYAPGTYVGFGPMVASQSSATWPGLLPGYFHYVRVNTGAPSGWAPSNRIAFQTRSDCPTTVPPTPVPTALPTATPVAATATPVPAATATPVPATLTPAATATPTS